MSGVPIAFSSSSSNVDSFSNCTIFDCIMFESSSGAKAFFCGFAVAFLVLGAFAGGGAGACVAFEFEGAA